MKSVILFAMLFGLIACNASKEDVKKALKEDPTILAEAIKANPLEFMTAVREAAQVAQKLDAEKKQADEKQKLEATYDSPLAPIIRPDEMFRGSKDAPITLVEYSDFECPFCTRAFATVKELLKKYDGKIRFAYKHLPLSFHPNAMGAAKYHEALRLQSEDKAWKYHDELMANLQKVKQGDKYFKSVAKKLGADMGKLAKDVESEAVKKRIDEDMKEAEKFGFRGTPGFLLNGIPVKGAYPTSHFDGIIEELKKRGKLNI